MHTWYLVWPWNGKIKIWACDAKWIEIINECYFNYTDCFNLNKSKFLKEIFSLLAFVLSNQILRVFMSVDILTADFHVLPSIHGTKRNGHFKQRKASGTLHYFRLVQSIKRTSFRKFASYKLKHNVVIHRWDEWIYEINNPSMRLWKPPMSNSTLTHIKL